MIDIMLAITSFLICIAIVVVVCVGLFYGRKDVIQEREDLEEKRKQEAIEANKRMERIALEHKKRAMKAKMKRSKNNPA